MYSPSFLVDQRLPPVPARLSLLEFQVLLADLVVLGLLQVPWVVLVLVALQYQLGQQDQVVLADLVAHLLQEALGHP